MSGDHSTIHRLKTEVLIQQQVVNDLTNILVTVSADRDAQAAALATVTAQLAAVQLAAAAPPVIEGTP